MKSEAPEKIWVHELSAKELNVPLKEYHIEYVRADAFIEKACEWLEPVMKNYAGYYAGTDILEDFKKYMKGE